MSLTQGFRRQKIGDILVALKYITSEQRDYILQKSRISGQLFGRVAREYGFITDRQIAEAMSKKIGWPLWADAIQLAFEVIVPTIEEDQASSNKISIQKMKEYGILPALIDNQIVFLFVDPINIEATDYIFKKKKFDELTVAKYVISEYDFNERIDTYLIALNKEKIRKYCERIANSEDVIREFAEFIIKAALECRASDIHVEVYETNLEIRFRIDGILHLVGSIPKAAWGSFVNCYYDLVEFQPGVYDQYQSGRFNMSKIKVMKDLQERKLEIRFSTAKTEYGVSAVMRLLGGNLRLLSLSELGYDQAGMRQILDSCSNTNGSLTILAGPVGSGKTTTLYAMLNIMKGISRKIITAEDPVERRIPMIQQCQIEPLKKMSYESCTREFLRQDPDVILVGEIRDEQTASVVTRAALTGHKMFSTLHARSAIGTIRRLCDLKVPIDIIADTLDLVIFQKLIRRLCPYCRQEQRLTNEQYLKIMETDRWFIANPKGCDRCTNGYYGRMVASEVMTITEGIRERIAENKVWEIRSYAVERGFKTIDMVLRNLIKTGLTTLEEASRVVPESTILGITD
jgi:type II secretory ATPase GspE/PulE/Tfp pilus assembly ATPase PilB-like protein